MSYANRFGITLPIGRINIIDPEAARAEIQSVKEHYVVAFDRFVADVGLQSLIKVGYTDGPAFANVELSVFETNGSHLSVPHLLFPIDPTLTVPDFVAIEAALLRSVSQMVSKKAEMMKIWNAAIIQLQKLFKNRPEATLERIDFLIDSDGSLALHVAFFVIQHDLNTVRLRRVSKKIDKLVRVISDILIDHDLNVAASTVNGKVTYPRYMTSLASKVFEIIEIEPFDLFMFLDGELQLNFQSFGDTLPFSSGSFHWSRATLNCSLAMKKGNCWIDGERISLVGFNQFPATSKTSYIGQPLAKLVDFEGLEFEATVTQIVQKDKFTTIDIDIPTTQFI